MTAATPIKQAYLNQCLPSDQRATLLSFDGLVASLGGALFQPVLGRVADFWSYGFSFLVAGIIQALSIPFVLLARAENAHADIIEE